MPASVRSVRNPPLEALLRGHAYLRIRDADTATFKVVDIDYNAALTIPRVCLDSESVEEILSAAGWHLMTAWTIQNAAWRDTTVPLARDIPRTQPYVLASAWVRHEMVDEYSLDFLT